MIVGVVLPTMRVTVAEVVLKFAESVGVKVTDNVCEPADKEVPRVGE